MKGRVAKVADICTNDNDIHSQSWMLKRKNGVLSETSDCLLFGETGTHCLLCFGPFLLKLWQTLVSNQTPLVSWPFVRYGYLRQMERHNMPILSRDSC